MVDVKSDFDNKERGDFDVAHSARWTQSAIVHTKFVNNICRDKYTVRTISSSLLRSFVNNSLSRAFL